MVGIGHSLLIPITRLSCKPSGFLVTYVILKLYTCVLAVTTDTRNAISNKTCIFFLFGILFLGS